MTHEVTLHLDEKLVSKKDVEIEVKEDESKLGTLLVSRGNIEWLPANNSVNKFCLGWSQFAELMTEKGRKTKVTRN